MTLKKANDETQKVTITLPRLALEEQALALAESAGAWTDENHPEMQDDAAIDRWLAGLRRSWTPRGELADDSPSA